jgi:hypothetical protein
MCKQIRISWVMAREKEKGHHENLGYLSWIVIWRCMSLGGSSSSLLEKSTAEGESPVCGTITCEHGVRFLESHFSGLGIATHGCHLSHPCLHCSPQNEDWRIISFCRVQRKNGDCNWGTDPNKAAVDSFISCDNEYCIPSASSYKQFLLPSGNF